MADTLIPINIIIGDRSYRIKIEPADEEVVRSTVRTVNEKITEFKTNFAGKDMQDYIAMVLIWLATTLASRPAGAPNTEETAQKLQALEQMLDKVLTQNP
jgi:cell division protein ZapA (FtsZ GTPase activity inhibitor)